MLSFSKIIMLMLFLFFAHSTQAQTIIGAGATFPAPLYAKWSDAVATAIGIQLNYQSIGSGGGQNQIINRTVDFGASDAPLSSEKLTQNNLVQIPTVMGAVVVIVNIPGVASNQLKLRGDIIADIYSGKISSWDDPRIVADNPTVNLPRLAIAPIYRGDGSGTTFVFTSYLSDVSETFKTTIGANQSVRWPVGSGTRGNDGVAGTVRQIRGGIGYVENAYATRNNLITTQLMNRDGKWTSPTPTTFIAASQNANWETAENFAVSLINQPGENSWPILSATFLLIPENATNPEKTRLVIRWLGWAYEHGDALAQGLDYIPLPQSVQQRVMARLSGLVK
jgi:phosphate transport system substrate-binding protein